jgi:phage pi2 protein 07
VSTIKINIKKPNASFFKGDAQTSELNKIELTLDILPAPAGLNTDSKYPYMIEHKKLPSDTLFSLLFTGYGSIIQFFFNRTTFKTTLGVDELNKADEGDPQEILDYNVKLMLSLIFPTKYPVPRNHFNSYGNFMANTDSTVVVKGQIEEQLFLNPDSTSYTYINLDGAKYTITRVVWLNDLYNNPLYRVLINGYMDFKRWIDISKPTILNSIKNMLLDILTNQNCYILFNNNVTPKSVDTTIKNINQTKESVTPKTMFEDELISLYNDIYEVQESSRKTKTIGTTDYTQKMSELSKLFNSVHDKIQKNDIQTAINRVTKTDDDNNILKNPEIIDFIQQLNIIYRNYTNVSGTKFSKEFKDCMDYISKKLQEIGLEKRVFENYLLPKKYIINETDETIKAQIETKYVTLKNYSSVVKSLKSSKSANTLLQDSITDYINGKESVFSTIMENIQYAVLHNQLIKSVITPNVKILNTSVGRINPNNINEPQYEIFVGMDLVKGELNNENVKTIHCAYEGYYLGQQLSLLSVAFNEVDFVVVSLDDLEKRSKKTETDIPTKKGGGGAGKMTKKQYFIYLRKTKRRGYVSKK